MITIQLRFGALCQRFAHGFSLIIGGCHFT
jgi:hypothetical protein